MVKRTCSYPECENPNKAKGYCTGHYKQFKAGKELRPLPPRGITVCTFPDCGRPHIAKGYCTGHWQQYKKGTPLKPLGRRSLTPDQRFLLSVEKTDTCWLWTGYMKQHNYGLFMANNKQWLTHRYAYEKWVGPIPQGKFLDHICHNPSCVRPDHLRPVSNKQNRENHSGLQKNNKSGFRGVSWFAHAGKWAAQVGHNGKVINLGLFECPEEAGEAAKQKRLELHTHNDLDRANQ